MANGGHALVIPGMKIGPFIYSRFRCDDTIAYAPRFVKGRLAAAIGELRKTKKFGLAFEKHVPEV
jgi:hypothetical protein